MIKSRVMPPEIMRCMQADEDSVYWAFIGDRQVGCFVSFDESLTRLELLMRLGDTSAFIATRGAIWEVVEHEEAGLMPLLSYPPAVHLYAAADALRANSARAYRAAVTCGDDVWWFGSGASQEAAIESLRTAKVKAKEGAAAYIITQGIIWKYDSTTGTTDKVYPATEVPPHDTVHASDKGSKVYPAPAVHPHDAVHTSDNGSTPFVVTFGDGNGTASLYVNKARTDPKYECDHVLMRVPELLRWNLITNYRWARDVAYVEVFRGGQDGRADGSSRAALRDASNAGWYGGSVLLRLPPKTPLRHRRYNYMCIGRELITFSTSQPIIYFYSPNSTSDVSRPYALTEDWRYQLDHRKMLVKRNVFDRTLRPDVIRRNASRQEIDGLEIVPASRV